MAKRKKENKNSSAIIIIISYNSPIGKRKRKKDLKKKKTKKKGIWRKYHPSIWHEMRRGKKKTTCCCWWWSLDVEYQNAIIALYRPMDRQPFESAVFLRLGGPQEILFGSCKMKSAYVEVWKGNSKTYQSWLHSMPLSSFYPTTFCFSFPNTIKNWRGGKYSGAI